MRHWNLSTIDELEPKVVTRLETTSKVRHRRHATRQPMTYIKLATAAGLVAASLSIAPPTGNTAQINVAPAMVSVTHQESLAPPLNKLFVIDREHESRLLDELQKEGSRSVPAEEQRHNLMLSISHEQVSETASNLEGSNARKKG